MTFNLRPEHQKILEEINGAKGRLDQTRPDARPQQGQAQPLVAPAGQGHSADSVKRLTPSHAPAPCGPPGISSVAAANGPGLKETLPTGNPALNGDSELLARLQGADLMKLLGFVNLTEHSVEIRRYYLLGCAYHHGAHSVRQILKLLDDPPPAFLADDLAEKVRNTTDVSKNDLFITITRLEKLLNASLVIRLGEGLPFAGLNNNGEAFWKMVAEYLRENW